MTCRVDSSQDLSSPSFVWSKPTPAMPRPPKPHPRDHRCAESVSAYANDEHASHVHRNFHWGHLSGKFWEEVLCPVFRFIKDEAFDDDDGNRQGCRRETRATVPCTRKFFYCRRERALPSDAFGSREQARAQRNRSTCCRQSVFWWNNIRSITGEEISGGLSKAGGVAGRNGGRVDRPLRTVWPVSKAGGGGPKRIFQNASNRTSGRGYEPLYGQIAVRWTIVGCCLDGRVTCRGRQLFATAFVGFTSSSVGQALCACCLLAGLLLAVCSTNRENSDG
ncbi:hypothetical protein T02_1437 [Trichinella nativa]|uniref:Uncharacterized protein n=1 Tax=Trichinella nativa TaxID=6335 RepID=A0A0V1LFU5_9BILA|nr:hypothetical protein T02_1437 [Trichinella nativa]